MKLKLIILYFSNIAYELLDSFSLTTERFSVLLQSILLYFRKKWFTSIDKKRYQLYMLIIYYMLYFVIIFNQLMDIYIKI